MKQGTALNRIVMLLFLAAILLYFGGAAWRSFRAPYPTAQAFAYRVDDTVEATGSLVRQERVITGDGGIVRLLPSEGEKVAVGSTLAMLYADQSSVERSDRLEALEREADQMEKTMAAGSDRGDQTAQGVEDALVKLRASVAAGDFTRLEDHSLAFKSAIYQQSQRSGAAVDLDLALAALRQEMDGLRAQTAQSTGRVAAPESGVFSGLVDGFETVLTPAALEGLTPSALAELERAPAPAGAALCKLITGSKWYFACSLKEADASRLYEGGTVTARFSRDWSGDVEMKVEHLSAPENGKVAVTLSSTKYLSEVTLLRRQTVDLVFSSREGVRVPTAAVRVEDGATGVYVLVGVKAEFKPVTVLAQGEDYYLVEPKLPENAEAKQKKKALRPGDAVIVASQEIWDGKVVA